jgi:hypothetical protein
MALNEKMTQVDSPKMIEMRTESDVRAFVKLILDKKSCVVKSRKVFGEVVEVVCELPKVPGASEFAPLRSFSLFFPLTGSATSSFRERFIKKLLNGQSEKDLKKLDPWETFHEESDLVMHFGLSAPLEAGNLKMFIFTTAPRSEGVLAAVAEIRANLKGVRIQDWWDQAERFRPMWLGPGVVAGVLAVAALALALLHGRGNVYHFGHTATSGIPNLVVAGFFLSLAILALLRRVAVTYAFLTISLATTLVQVILGYLFGQKGSWSFGSWVIALFNLFLLIWIPARGQDFHLFSVREFWRRITFR